MKKLFYLFLAVATICGCSKSSGTVEATAQTNDDVILHAWSWSFNSIRENMKDIADAGYTIVQTSPVQHCITCTASDPKGGNQLFGHGFWYYHYQPTDWKIGNYQLGNEAELIALCQEAAKYGVRIIVDVLPNHTAIDDTKVEPDLDAAVGGHANLYHAAGRTPITDYNDRLQCTTGEMGGLPDVNTENPDFQAYYLNYVNTLIKDGVRGFRYDTAKHIGLPSDPKDPRSPENDFWDVVTGRKSVKGVSLCMPMDSLFMYGEVLQDRNVKETEYAEYMGLTASSLGHCIREDLHAASWTRKDVTSFSHPVEPAKLVTWVESHDTYCNDHESASLSDEQIKAGWVFLVARQLGTPLFYSRPDGSDGPSGNFWGNNVVGAKGNDSFRNPEVVAANKFRRSMSGKPEKVTYAGSGAVAMVERGVSGAALINITGSDQVINAQTVLPDGTYVDAVSGRKFTVRSGMMKGSLAPYGTYIIQK